VPAEPAGPARRPTGVRRLLLVLPLLLLAAACGSGDDAASGDALVTGLGDLVVEQDAGDGTPPQRWTLGCAEDGTATGDHPDAAAACAHLRDLDEPFAPLGDDLMCTQQYGGDQTARVTGTWRGEPVDLALSRTDGCRIAQWDGLGPLLPGPVGVDLPQ
jgi:hypothetical protein